jgi:hypothetical protein
MTIRARRYPTNDFEVALDALPTCIAADWQSKSEDLDWAPHGASEDRHNKVKFLSIVCPTVASWPSVASLLGRTFPTLHSPKRVSIELRALEALLHQRVRCSNHHCWQSKPVSSLGLVPLQDLRLHTRWYATYVADLSRDRFRWSRYKIDISPERVYPRC